MRKIKFIFVNTLFIAGVFLFGVDFASANMANPNYLTPTQEVFTLLKIASINAIIEIMVFMVFIFKTPLLKYFKTYVAIFIVNFVTWFMLFGATVGRPKIFTNGLGLLLFLIVAELLIILLERTCYSIIPFFRGNLSKGKIWLATISANAVSILAGIVYLFFE